MRWTSLLVALGFGSVLSLAQSGYAGKPYTVKPQTIPGRIQAEFYDQGGEGVAYHDTDAINHGSGTLNKGDSPLDRFRAAEGVDISYTKETHDKVLATGAVEKPGELYVGWTEPGEWLRYSVNVVKSGRYVINGHISSANRNAAIEIEFEDGAKTGPMVFASTGHPHRWRQASRLGVVTLTQGKHVMTLRVLREGKFNIDYLDFVADSAPVSAAEINQRLGRGVNVIGYDPLWKDMAQARFHDRHFELLRDGGFHSVRINLQAFAHMDADHQLNPAWFKTLDWAVGKALAANLMVILDLHEFNNVAQDPERYHALILAFWKQVAEHYKNASGDVVFEILNEPNGKLTPELWNQYLAEALAEIRKSNPARAVIAGPAFWNNINYLAKLELPDADRHLIVTVHYYTPMEFTHQGAPWNKETTNLSGVVWGSDEDKARAVKDLTVAAEWARLHDRPIYLGEFGAYDKAPMESRARYTDFIARTAESFGWSWGYWQFDSDFILFDIDHDHWIEPIWKALIP
jgi:endoglucanase